MKTIYIPSSAWIGERFRCESLVYKFVLADIVKTDSLILDLAAVKREIPDAPKSFNAQLFEIDFRAWVGETLTEGGVIDIHAIRRTVATLCEHIVVINAIGFDSQIIYRALFQLRVAFYSLAGWPRCLVLIGDDSQLHQISPMLANTFYIQPSILSKFKANVIVRQIVNEAFLIRIFGRRIGAYQKFIQFLSKLLAKHQDKKERRSSGWIFEE